MKLEDLTGKQFGRLTVIERAPNNGKRTMWLCRCSCGTEKIINAHKLKSGNTVSCGCRRAEGLGDFMRTHGMTETRLYGIWSKMKGRCLCPTNESYNAYGGRGIRICDEWADDFMAFYNWAISNGYAETLSIDRIDNDGNYCPDNCRWITFEENARKQRIDQHMKNHGFYHGTSPDGITYDFMDAKSFGEQHGLSGSAIRNAVVKGNLLHGWKFWQDK